ncbi:Rid family hydrolase [Boseaceae bacterium BT-24-1]|nr:Rid family hydrolase [Boseaceae bacterium BT-24-1]
MDRLSYSTSSLPGCDRHPIPGAVRHRERLFLSGSSAVQSDGSIKGGSDPAAQTHAALDRLETALDAAGASLDNITKLTTSIVDRGYRAEVYRALSQRLAKARPVSTGLVVSALPRPDLIVQIDAEGIMPENPLRFTRPYSFENWHGQGFPWTGSMAIRSDVEVFVRGQTGSGLDHSGIMAKGRGLDSAADQAELAMTNLSILLQEAGTSLDDVCKITVYISDRVYRPAVYPVLGRHFGEIRPVSTGIVTTAFASPEILFELDVVVLPQNGGDRHLRLRPYDSADAYYGSQRQGLGSKLCMAVVAGDRVILRGQTGMDLEHVLRGAGDASAQAEQAMDNVAELLGEAGATLDDVVKATVYVTEPDYLAGVNASVLRRFANPPAFTSFVVKGLASPELLMEVDIVAVKRA